MNMNMYMYMYTCVPGQKCKKRCTLGLRLLRLAVPRSAAAALATASVGADGTVAQIADHNGRTGHAILPRVWERVKRASTTQKSK